MTVTEGPEVPRSRSTPSLRRRLTHLPGPSRRSTFSSKNLDRREPTTVKAVRQRPVLESFDSSVFCASFHRLQEPEEMLFPQWKIIQNNDAIKDDPSRSPWRTPARSRSPSSDSLTEKGTRADQLRHLGAPCHGLHNLSRKTTNSSTSAPKTELESTPIRTHSLQKLPPTESRDTLHTGRPLQPTQHTVRLSTSLDTGQSLPRFAHSVQPSPSTRRMIRTAISTGNATIHGQRSTPS